MKYQNKEKCEHEWIYLSEGVLMCDKCSKTTLGGPEDDRNAWDNVVM